MPANLAPTFFQSGPDDKAVAVDVYGKPPLDPTNQLPNVPQVSALQSTLGNLGNKALKFVADDFIKNGKLLDSKKAIDNIAKAFKQDLKLVKSAFSDGKFYDSLLKSSGFYNTGIGKVVNGLVNVTTGANKQGGAGLRDLNVTINGVKKFFKNVEDLDSLTDVTKFITDISGDNEYVKILNLTQVAAVSKGVAFLASDLGLTGALDKLLGNVTDPQEKRMVAGLIATSIDTPVKQNIADELLDFLTGEELKNANPQIVPQILAGFSETDEFPYPSVEAANSLIATLNRVDVHWFQKFNNGTFMDNIAVFKDQSQFARECLLLTEDFKVLTTLADSYQSDTFYSLAKRDFPLIGIQSN